MNLDLVFSNKTKEKSLDRAFFFQIIKTALKILKIKSKHIELSVNIVSPIKIKNLNKKYRNKNKVTDVLSFPAGDNNLNKYGIMPLGDIFICSSYVHKDGKRFLVHGLLHLLGYDHEKSKKEAQAMFRLEEKILNKV